MLMIFHNLTSLMSFSAATFFGVHMSTRKKEPNQALAYRQNKTSTFFIEYSEMLLKELS